MRRPTPKRMPKRRPVPLKQPAGRIMRFEELPERLRQIAGLAQEDRPFTFGHSIYSKQPDGTFLVTDTKALRIGRR